MLTKNFWNWMLSNGCVTTIRESITDVNGTVCDIVIGPSGSYLCSFGEGLFNLGTTQGAECAMLGTGATKASPLDYKLESPITSGISVTNPTALVRTTGDDAHTAVAALYVVTNTSGADITVGEIGLFSGIESYNEETHLALIDRTVLDEPVTIPAGESRQIMYVIQFRYPE